jgi:hypothetical protein
VRVVNGVVRVAAGMNTLDLCQIAQVLRISVKTARNRLTAGLPMPPSFVVGRQRLFLQDQVDEWLRQQPGALLEPRPDLRPPVPPRRGRPRAAG